MKLSTSTREYAARPSRVRDAIFQDFASLRLVQDPFGNWNPLLIGQGACGEEAYNYAANLRRKASKGIVMQDETWRPTKDVYVKGGIPMSPLDALY
jgi:hypothetical protein